MKITKTHSRIYLILILLCGLVLPFTTSSQQTDWQPAKGRLMTEWADDVSPNNAHPVYPRPQMKRDYWKNLNGL